VQSVLPQVQQLMSNPDAMASVMRTMGSGAGSPFAPFADNPQLQAQMQAAAAQMQSNPAVRMALAWLAWAAERRFNRLLLV
jgi:hypothetical protein